MRDRVVRVNQRDNPIGTAQKYAVHRNGALHRALSVFLFDSEHRLLLQQRHPGKYHSGGLWSNTCCTHPYPEEAPLTAAHRCLKEEMGICCDLTRGFTIRYYLRLDAGLYEHEFDHVFIGHFDEVPTPDEREVTNWKWAAPSALWENVSNRPDRYTPWFRLMLGRAIDLVSDDGREGW